MYKICKLTQSAIFSTEVEFFKSRRLLRKMDHNFKSKIRNIECANLGNDFLSNMACTKKGKVVMFGGG